MRTISITEPSEMYKILNYVHDREFILSSISYDNKLHSLSIPITVISDEKMFVKKTFFIIKWKNPILEAVLLIKNVDSYVVKDEANIDQGLINTITVDGNRIIIKSSVPVEIDIDISKLDIELIFSDIVKKYIARFSI